MSNEKRSEARLPNGTTAFLEVTGGSTDSLDLAPIIMCRSLDVSTKGLRLCVDEPLEVGTILQIALEPPGMDTAVHVVAEVRWSKEAEGEPGHWVGFEILESDDTDRELWAQVVEQMN